jgi:protein arginine kinase activator
MLCQNCEKRVAKVYFTKVINNKKIEMYLCEQCARGKGQLSFTFSIDPFNIGEFFSGLLGYQSQTPFTAPIPQDLICERCGMSFNQFQKTGKLGCSNCYEKFKDRLSPLMNRIHGHVQHNGKVPEKLVKSIETSKEIEKMKEQLAKAIQNEEYEKAAELRDKIKVIENAM